MVARGRLWEYPGHPKPSQSAQKVSILHKYCAHPFERAPWPALWPKPAQNYMTETMFGLRRRERIACWPFYKKLATGPFLRDFGVLLGAKSSHLDHFGLAMAFFFAAGFGVVVGVMGTVGPQPKTTSSQKAKSI